LLEIDLKILFIKTGARLIFKIALISLRIDPGLVCRVLARDQSSNFNEKNRSTIELLSLRIDPAGLNPTIS
jgi:hypothetical protein